MCSENQRRRRRVEMYCEFREIRSDFNRNNDFRCSRRDHRNQFGVLSNRDFEERNRNDAFRCSRRAHQSHFGVMSNRDFEDRNRNNAFSCPCRQNRRRNFSMDW